MSFIPVGLPSELGVAVVPMPATPERIWRALREHL